jgi:polysaccharide biosynthesis transport protein
VFLAQYDVNLREYWRIVRKRKFTVLLVALLLGVLSTAFAVFKAPTPIYSTECVIEIKREPFVEGVYSQTISWSESDDIETQMTVIKSYAVFEKAAERLGLVPRGSNPGDGKPLEARVVAVIENLQAKVEVSRQKYSSILNIKAKDERPAFAQDLANAVALGYREVHGEQQTRRTREALRYIDDQLREVRIKLREAEERFNGFSKQNDLLSIDLQSENLVAQAQEIRKEKAKLEEEKSEFEGIADRLRKFIDNPVGAGHNFDSVLANNRYHSANDALVNLLLKRDTLLREFTPKHPDVMAVNDGVIENARKMDYLLQLQLRSIERRQEELSRELERLDSRTKGMLDKKLEFNRLKREVELHTDMTTLLERKNQEALIKRSEKPEEVNIVKPALLPSNPINPPKTAATGAMGIVIGVVFGLLIAFVLETFDTSLGAIENVEHTLKTPVLGVIPQVDVRDIQETLNDRHPGGIDEHAMKQAVNLIAHFVPKSMMAESFRALRAGIQFKNTEKKIKTLAITSASPQEGKTLVAVNLAITMAQAGMKTLLVGSDLRKPTLARILGVETNPGLSDILLGNLQWRKTVKGIIDLVMGEISLDEIMITPGLDNLYFITGGAIPPNPAELIESERFDRFVAEAKDEFDMMIFDTAPILSAVDAAIIGTKMDGMLLLYRVGAVSRGLLKRAMSQMEQVKSQVVGVILNGMRPELSPDFEDYKHYKYYYSYSEDGRKHSKKKSFSWFKKKPMAQEKPKLLRPSLLLAALVTIGAGVLWHNGAINPLSLVGAGGAPEKQAFDQERVAIELSLHSGLQGANIAHRRQEAPASRPKAAEPNPNYSQDGPRIEVKAQAPAPGIHAQKEAPQDRIADPHTPLEVPRTAWTGVTPSIATATQTSGPVAAAGLGALSLPASESRLALTTREANEAAQPSDRGEGVNAKDAVEVRPDERLEPNAFPYALYLGSASAQFPERAKEGMAQYRRRGVEAYWVEVELSKRIWYRIYAGCFSNPEDAEKFKEAKGLHKAEVKEVPYGNLIGAYGSLKEAQEQIQALKGQGFSPYVVEGPAGTYRVFVGAFYDEERAARQLGALKEKGIESEIVKR